MRQVHAALAATVLLVVALLAVPAQAPSQGAPWPEFSADALIWTTDVPPLFAEEFIVPGQRASATLWVRNGGQRPADPILTIADNGTDPTGAPLRDWLTLRFNGQGLSPGQQWTGATLAPNGVAQVDIEVRMSPAAPATSRAQSTKLIAHATFAEP